MKIVRELRQDLIGRIWLLNVLVTGLLAAIACAYWFAQIVEGEHYRELAENNRLRKLPIKAPRGLIYDRNGHLLVENIPSYNLLVDRSRSDNLQGAIRFVAGVLGRPIHELAAILERVRSTPDFKPVLLAEHLTLEQVAAVSVRGREFPEFEVEVQNLRLYRHGPQTAHVLGYLGEVTQSEVDRSDGSYAVGDLVGKRGIEQVFDKVLRGRDGERVVVVDSRGKLLDEYGRTPVEAGRPLHLTLDLDLQQEAIRQFEGADAVGSVVALDPRNGEILALVSAPSYDPNLFARRLGQEEWNALIGAPHDPMRDRAIQNTYSPGSVFKIMMAAAGLAEGVVNENDSVWCDGSASIYGHRFRCWSKGGHGRVNLHDALEHSCDVYFYHLGQRLGIERIARYSRMFGLGSKTGIELRGENAGLVPDSAWSLAARKHPWFLGETISVAIGQGPVLTSPLQIATVTALIANGGRPIRPHLIQGEEVEAPDADRPPLPPRALEAVREGMDAVVNDPGGTARTARLPNVRVAGKTGTVQVIGQAARTNPNSLPFRFRDHGWFTSFAPVDHPEIVVVAFVEHGGSGSKAAAPIAKAVLAKYFSTARQRR
jgi:penicillin-binding protein 2